MVWWLERFTRYLYEIPRDLDHRLVPWREDWRSDLTAKYERYLQLTELTL
jgi:hypothetical protein